MAGNGSEWASKLVRDEFAKKLLWVVVAVIGGVVAAATAWALSYITILDIVLLGLVLALALGAAANAVMARRSYRIPWYPRVGHHFLILEKTIGYKVQSDGSLHFWRKMRVKALSDNLDAYIDKFVWTGGAKVLPAAGVGVLRIEEDITASIWTFYRTVLPCTLRKGDEHEFQVDWHLDDWATSRPFFSTSTEEPTKRLTLELEVPAQSIAPGGVYFEDMRGIESSYPFRADVLQPDRGRIVHSFRPKLYRHYRLRWAWAGAQLKAMPEVASEVSDAEGIDHG